jgi:copper chaperone CopZ
MKKALFGFAVLLCASGAALGETKTESIKVSGWKCDDCPGKTEAKVKKVKGVQSATANREKGELLVKYDDTKANRAALEKAVADSGFQVEK